MNSNMRLMRVVSLLGLALAALVPQSIRAEPFAASAFRALWWRTDQLVHEGGVTRTWLWGPDAGYSTYEVYADSPGGQRLVQYFDKSRMEINNPDAPRNQWYVTNGLLVREMATGRIQTGNNQFSPRGRLLLPVAGDRDRNAHMPTYDDFGRLDPALADDQRQPDRSGRAVTAFWDPMTQAGPFDQPSLATRYPETAFAYYDQTTALNVPAVFWRYMHQAGDVLLDNRRVRADPLYDWLYVVGRPISAAYWTRGLVGGAEKDILVQLFERRVLTYTPANAPGWQVEMGNVGQHYLLWRYHDAPVRPGTPEFGAWQPLYRRGSTLYSYDSARSHGDALINLPDGSDNFVQSTRGSLAFAAGDTLYLADPAARTLKALYQAKDRAAPAWNLRWSTDGLAVAYALAYDDAHGSRVVELGTHDGTTQRTVTTIEGRPGPAPASGTPQGFTQFQILGYNRDAARIWVVPVAGTEQYKAVWSFAVATGEPSTPLTFDDPASIRDVASSPDLSLLAISRTPDRLTIRSLFVPQATAREYRVSVSGAPTQLRWSNDGSRVAFAVPTGTGNDAVFRLWLYDLAREAGSQLWTSDTDAGFLYGWHPGNQALAVRWYDRVEQHPRHGLVELRTGLITEFDPGPDIQLVGWLALR